MWVKRVCLGHNPSNLCKTDCLLMNRDIFTHRKCTTALYCPSLYMHTYITAAKVGFSCYCTNIEKLLLYQLEANIKLYLMLQN